MHFAAVRNIGDDSDEILNELYAVRGHPSLMLFIFL
jgi:hypothetical protein